MGLRTAWRASPGTRDRFPSPSLSTCAVPFVRTCADPQLVEPLGVRPDERSTPTTTMPARLRSDCGHCGSGRPASQATCERAGTCWVFRIDQHSCFSVQASWWSAGRPGRLAAGVTRGTMRMPKWGATGLDLGRHV